MADMTPLRVVVLCGVGPFGGSSRSLFEVLRALPAGRADIRIIAARGTAVPYHRQVARDVVVTRGLSKLDHTRYSHYRGVRWLVVLREVFHVPFTLWAILRARRLWGPADVVHANEITELLPLVFAKWVFGAAAVQHVRSLQHDDRRLWRTRFIQQRLARSVEAVIAIDETVRATLPAELAVDVIHNTFGVAPEDIAPIRAPASPAGAPTDGTEPMTVGFVGNLLRVKGLLDLVEAAAAVRASGRHVRYLVVGGATRAVRGLRHRALTRLGLAQDVGDELHAQLQRHGLTDAFEFVGHTPDIARLYRQMDVLCFPSHLDAPGRPVFEAAFFGLPSIVAVRTPRPDTLQPGVTGLAFPGRDVRALAEAIAYFHDHPDERRRMGAEARRLAERNYSPATNALRLLEVYARAAATRRSRA